MIFVLFFLLPEAFGLLCSTATCNMDRVAMLPHQYGKGNFSIALASCQRSGLRLVTPVNTATLDAMVQLCPTSVVGVRRYDSCANATAEITATATAAAAAAVPSSEIPSFGWVLIGVLVGLIVGSALTAFALICWRKKAAAPTTTASPSPAQTSRSEYGSARSAASFPDYGVGGLDT
jgi:hypothetical protein